MVLDPTIKTLQLLTRLTYRKAYVAISPLNAFYERLMLFIFQGDRFLLPWTTLKLKLDRSTHVFCLSSAAAVKNISRVENHKAMLHVIKCEINDSVRKAYMQLLTEENNVKYPITGKRACFMLSIKELPKKHCRCEKRSGSRACFYW